MPLLNNSYLPQWGWAVLDSLWQFGIIYLVYAAVRHAAGKYLKPAHSYLLLLLLVSGGTIIFLFNLLQPLFGGSYQPVITRLEVPAVYAPWLQNVLVCTGFVYLLFSLVRLLLFLRLLLKRTGREINNPQLDADFKEYLHELCAMMGIRVPVIRFTSEAVSPFVTGLFRHFIIIPASLVNRLSPQEMEAVILHELAHIRRGDIFTNLLVVVAGQLLWFNPFATELIRELRKQRELACDDEVMRLGVQPVHYASSLHKVAVFQNNPAAWQLPMSAAGGELMHRVQRLFKNYQPPRNRTSKKPFLSLLVVVLMLILAGKPGRQLLPGQVMAIPQPTALQVNRILPENSYTTIENRVASQPIATPRKPAARPNAISAKPVAPVINNTAGLQQQTEDLVILAAAKAELTPAATYVNEGNHRSADVVLRFTDSVLVFENFISRRNMESSTSGHLAAMLNIIAGINEELADVKLGFSGSPGEITVLQDGAPNLYFHNATLQHEAVYNPASKEWRIHFTLMNGDDKLGERFVTIYRKVSLNSTKL